MATRHRHGWVAPGPQLVGARRTNSANRRSPRASDSYPPARRRVAQSTAPLVKLQAGGHFCNGQPQTNSSGSNRIASHLRRWLARRRDSLVVGRLVVINRSYWRSTCPVSSMSELRPATARHREGRAAELGAALALQLQHGGPTRRSTDRTLARPAGAARTLARALPSRVQTVACHQRLGSCGQVVELACRSRERRWRVRAEDEGARRHSLGPGPVYHRRPVVARPDERREVSARRWCCFAFFVRWRCHTCNEASGTGPSPVAMTLRNSARTLPLRCRARTIPRCTRISVRRPRPACRRGSCTARGPLLPVDRSDRRAHRIARCRCQCRCRRRRPRSRLIPSTLRQATARPRASATLCNAFWSALLPRWIAHDRADGDVVNLEISL